MKNTITIFLILFPLFMVLLGYLMARRFKPFESMPEFAKMFGPGRLPISLGMGFLLSLIFTFYHFFDPRLSEQLLYLFILQFLLVSIGLYVGLTLGWKQPFKAEESPSMPNRAQAQLDSVKIGVENLPDVLRITVRTKKRWGMFILTLPQQLTIAAIFIVFVFLFKILFLNRILPGDNYFLNVMIVGVPALYFTYLQIMANMDYLLDLEIIEISDQSVKIRKFGLGLKIQREYPAENIKKIIAFLPVDNVQVTQRHLPVQKVNWPGFWMYFKRGLKRYTTFGREVDLLEAQSILKTIYNRYPHYAG